MINLILNIPTDQEDLIPLNAGEHKCPKSHSYGPYIRDHHIIHFCLSGRGVLQNQSGEHPVEAGELFIIKEGELTTYTADPSNPWRYVWVCFTGRKAHVFDSASCVLQAPGDIVGRLTEYIEAGERSPDIYTSLLYELIYRLFTAKSEPDDTLSDICRYIKYHYMNDITAGGVAKLFGFERSYLYRMFKARYGIGIKEYITNVRMDHARLNLLSGYNVSAVAAMVGYHDEFNFSKAYKKHFGIPPITDRK